ncbi:hypothetical protein ACQ1Z1_14425, partial [Enterococcus faecalis]|uniref:hypothetical protein n=1 Tax=Enterococcus faecalis TaxID=1351 RepID=UPI003D6B5481
RCEMILSKISDNNKGKQFLINELGKSIKVCATEWTYTKIILKHISQIENYVIERKEIQLQDSKGQFHSESLITSCKVGGQANKER